MIRRIFTILSMVVSLGALSCTQVNNPSAPEDVALPEVSVSLPDTWGEFLYTGGTQELTLSVNRDWSIECDADWLAFDVSDASHVDAGKLRDVTIIVTALMNEVGNPKTATVRFKTSSVYADVVVKQASNPNEAPELLYYIGFGKNYEVWTALGTEDHPWIQDSRCWRYEEGAAISELEYYYTNKMSARNSGTYNSTGYNGASGGNHLHFGSGPGVLTLAKIKVHPKQTAITIGFGIIRTQYVAGSTPDNRVNLDEFQIFVSRDGASWVKCELMTSSKLENETWAYCTTGFAFGDDKPEYLYVRLAPTVASSYRFDDLKISKGNSTTVINWETGIPFDLGTPLESSGE